MRESKLKRISALLLVAALATTLGVNGIYAKYKTESSKDVEARVAKWGVTIEAVDGGFSSTYTEGGTTVASAESPIVAPGTSGEFNGLKISGKPEVAVKITNQGTLTLTGWQVNDTFYCPLKIKVGTTTLAGTSYNSAKAFEDAVNAEIAKLESTFAPGTDLSKADIPKVTWSWDSTDDAKDTALGNLQTAPTVKLVLKATVTQID
ncbi:MAG: hypothetical protein MJ146_03630 [Clostridia bacterium]|nr:hypothetical protein [Clostridia bacterium]